ncbi:MAG TPA: glycosyltransferase [Candidatus Limnocylindria bacterium]
MSAPLRVAIFGESYLPYLSGVTVSTETLARGLGAAGHEVLLVAPRPPDGLEPPGAGAPGSSPAYAWLPSYQPPPPAPPGYRMPWPVPSDSLSRARDFAPQIVHAQSPFLSGLMARRTAQRTGARLVFTHHTRFGDYRHYLGPLAGVAEGTLNAYLADFWAGCAAIIAPGTTLAAEISQRLGERRRPLVRVIPTGVDVGALQSLPLGDPRARFGFPADALIVASHGRLATEKNVELLMDGFAVAAAGDPRLRLVLIGGGPASDTVAARAALPDLAGRVGLTGRLPRTEALAAVAGADLFAFASQTETQGLVLAEALAVGLPVVALAGPGVEDSVRDGLDGVVVRSGSGMDPARALGEAILALAGDRARLAAMATEARQGAERFDVVRRIEETVTLYREVLGAAG